MFSKRRKTYFCGVSKLKCQKCNKKSGFSICEDVVFEKKSLYVHQVVLIMHESPQKCTKLRVNTCFKIARLVSTISLLVFIICVDGEPGMCNFVICHNISKKQ